MKVLLDTNIIIQREAIKKFLKQYYLQFKRPIKDLLIEYYRVLHNPDLKFEGQLLEQLGFRPCRACNNETNQTLNTESNNYADDYDLPF